jgi:hypothetical protein
MGHRSSRAVALGLGAAVSAFAAGAMMSAATAPTAHADDFSTIIADIQAEEAAAATAFSTAFTDGYDTPAGLTQLYIGLDDDLVGAPDILHVGTVDALTGATLPANLASDFEVSFATPTSLATATTEAQGFYTEGVALSTTILGLPTTDYADTALDNALSYLDQFVLPDQILSIGDAIANGL